jgi:hypothetical protein
MGRSIWHLRIRARRFAAGLVMCLAIGALMLAPPLPAFSQSLAPSGQAPDSTLSPAAPVAPAAPAVTPPAPARPAHNPGFLEELGKVLKDSASHLSSSWKGSQKTLEDLNAKTKDATESLTRVQSIITGRTACPMTANGAPDCVVAAEQLCKGKGFKTGKSLDIETAEKCSAKVYLYGRTGAPGECRTENFVTRAICQ